MGEPSGSEEDPSKPKNVDLRYMHRPPHIVPNYGKATSIIPKSSVSRVLLYDNVTQQHMLDVKLSHIRSEQQKSIRVLALHRKSFLLRRMRKHQLMQESRAATSGILDSMFGGSASHRRPMMVHSSVGEYSTRRENTQLPEIGRRSGMSRFQTDSIDGYTRMLHTMRSARPDRAHSVDGGKVWANRRTVQDKRFQGLENLLVRLDDPGDGYIELSPSYHRDEAPTCADLLSARLVQTTDATKHAQRS